MNYKAKGNSRILFCNEIDSLLDFDSIGLDSFLK